jgi:hypothetical protein
MDIVRRDRYLLGFRVAAAAAALQCLRATYDGR